MENKNYESMTKEELNSEDENLNKQLYIRRKMLSNETSKIGKLEIKHQLAESYYKMISGMLDDDDYRHDCQYTYSDKKSAVKKLERLAINLRESSFLVGKLTTEIQEIEKAQIAIYDFLYKDWIDDPDHEINVFIDDESLDELLSLGDE